jgi:hypothetical protein
MPAPLCERCGYRKNQHLSIKGDSRASTLAADVLLFCPIYFYLPSKTGDVEEEKVVKTRKPRAKKQPAPPVEPVKKKRGRPRKIALA